MFLSVTAYIIIPAYTLLFASGTDWFASNLSVIGNWPDRRLAFAGLGLVIGIYFHMVLNRLMVHLPRHGKESLLLNAAFLLLVMAVATPYLPRQVPFQAFLHVVFAFLSAVSLLFCLYRILWLLSATSGDARRLLKPYRITLLLITLFSGCLLLSAGIVSSALEIFFILTATIMVQRLYRDFSQIFTNSSYIRKRW